MNVKWFKKLNLESFKVRAKIIEVGFCAGNENCLWVSGMDLNLMKKNWFELKKYSEKK
jgi:hypothetical protein